MADDPTISDETDLEEVLDVELEDDLEEPDDELDVELDDAPFEADDPLLVDETVVDEAEVVGVVVPVERPAEKRGDDDDDEEEDFDADDVEEDLDTILKDRIAAGTEEEEEEEDAALDSEDRTNSANRVQPKRPDEFVCQSCFLVKHPSQLADAKHQLCADCV
jgi:hypothetical protein